MKPRYPTNVRFRRHANRPRLGIMVLGLVSVVVGFAVSGLFSQPAQGEGERLAVSAPEETREPEETKKEETPPLPVVPPPVVKAAPVEKPTIAVEKPTPPRISRPAPETPPPVEVRQEAPPAAVPEKSENPDESLTFFEALRQQQMVVPQASAETARFKIPVEPIDLPVDFKQSPPAGKGERKSPVPALAAQPPASGGYIIQVASFPSQEAAQKLSAELTRAGYSAAILPASAHGRTVYRVRLGPFANPAQAQSTLAALGPRASGAMLLRN